MIDEAYTERMAHELQQNRGKGDWRAWTDDPATDWASVLSELDHHVAKLRAAVESGAGLGTVQEYAADVGNNGMFAWRFALRDFERGERARTLDPMNDWQMYWVGEKSEVIVARSLQEAAAYIGQDAADEDFEGGAVDYDRDGAGADGQPSSLRAEYAKFLAAGDMRVDYLWSAYGD